MDSGLAAHGSRELEVLLRRCASGDRTALRQIYEVEAPRLKAVATRITGSTIAAEDVLHDVFLRLWQEAGAFDPARGSPRAWLTSLVRFRAMELRRRAGREMTGQEIPEEIDLSPDALARLARQHEGRALRACLVGLAPEARRLILMAFVGGHTHVELALRLELPLGTVKSTIRRGLAALRKCLDS